MTTLTRITAFLLASCLGIACTEVERVDATQVLAVVNGDLAEAKTFEARLWNETEQQGTEPRVFTSKLPFSFAIVPGDAAFSKQVLLAVTAKNAAGEIIAQSKAIASFVPKKLVGLQVLLNQVCRGQICGGGQTCIPVGPGAGICGATLPSGKTFEGQYQAGVELTDPTFGNPTLASDGGGAVTVGEGGAASGTPDSGGTPGSTVGTPGMSGGPGGAPGSGVVNDGGAPPDATNPGTNPDTGAATEDAGPAPECDPSKPCTAGYNCTAGKCVSMCETTTCDPSATCALTSGAPVCTCNNGFIPVPGSANPVMCEKSVQCAQAGCHANASCAIGPDMRPVCTCRTGYTGTGMACTPVTCPTLTIANGTVTGGTTYGQTATYRCSAGYTLNTLFANATRTCGANMMWSGNAPRCDPADCGPLAAPSGGRVTYSSGTTLGSTARYVCSNSAYVLDSTVTSRTCAGDPAAWSGAAGTPKCIGCGDGEVTRNQFLSEECDPRAGGNAWTCNSQCKKTTAYQRCGSDLDCSPGETCSPTLGCTKPCPGSCPPAVSPTRAACVLPSPYCWAMDCTIGGNDCPPGAQCQTTQGTMPVNVCTFI